MEQVREGRYDDHLCLYRFQVFRELVLKLAPGRECIPSISYLHLAIEQVKEGKV